jgi:hypothetical protein
MSKASSKSVSSRLLDTGQVARFRLQRHHLLQDEVPADAVTLCRDVCGVQAQVMSAAHLQLWARNHAITRDEVERALWKTRSLVKTSLMRQTVHLIPSDEFLLYIAALRSSRVAAALRVMSRCGIAASESEALTLRIVDILAAGPVTRAALSAAVRPKVSKRVRAWMERVWSIVRVPIAEGLICYGPGEGNQVTFIRADHWLTKHRPVAAEQAKAELFRRYLRAYGPATLRDFSHWSGMPMLEVKPIHPLLEEELVSIQIEKRDCWLLGKDVKALENGAERQGSVRLLPHFDPYLLAHREKDHLLEAKHYKRVYRNQGWISPVVMIDGTVAGVWSYKPRGNTLLVSIEPFGRLSRAVRAAIEQEAESLAGFFESKAEITFA